MEVPYLGTQAWIRSLNYSLIDDWRPWMIGDQIAGYYRFFCFDGLSLLTNSIVV
jgi:serine carboxypeptidase-like clade 1